jgi:hypothetical protein
MTTVAELNELWPPDHNATPWVETPDGSWTRLVGAGINRDMPSPSKKKGGVQQSLRQLFKTVCPIRPQTVLI